MEHPEGLTNIFPTQIGTYHIDLDKELINSVMQDYKISPLDVLNRGRTSYQQSYDSDFFLFDKRLNDLKNQIISKLNDYTSQTFLVPCAISSSWFNKMDGNGSVNAHRHNGSVVSGALYLEVPDHASPLVLKDPLEPYRMMELSTYFTDQYGVDVYEGLLILFPSWLEHKTFPQKDSRTVISFNTIHTNAANTL
tara:strand:- start:513 stop:1094 length:582 start_codon:yes stop_codon:yes gene_type:complete